MTIPSLMISLLVSGLLGSVGHCLGMCGPLNLMMAAQVQKNNLPGFLNFTLFHLTRIFIYTVMGGIVGGLGSLLGLSKQLTVVGGIVSLILGMGILIVGSRYLGWLDSLVVKGTSKWWHKAFSKAIKQKGFSGILFLGILNGLLPCGLVYSALLLVASTGKVWQGALGMLTFGLGTFPALIALDLGASAVSVRLRQKLLRVSGVLMLIIGLQLVLRGGATLQFWPHFHLGGVSIW